jgi:hypothetical protein
LRRLLSGDGLEFRVEDRSSASLTEIISADRSANHRYGPTAAMILCTNPGFHGDLSAQSRLRTGLLLRRLAVQRAPASCPRHERSLDTRYCFAASSKVESPMGASIFSGVTSVGKASTGFGVKIGSTSAPGISAENSSIETGSRAPCRALCATPAPSGDLTRL